MSFALGGQDAFKLTLHGRDLGQPYACLHETSMEQSMRSYHNNIRRRKPVDPPGVHPGGPELPLNHSGSTEYTPPSEARHKHILQPAADEDRRLLHQTSRPTSSNSEPPCITPSEMQLAMLLSSKEYKTGLLHSGGPMPQHPSDGHYNLCIPSHAIGGRYRDFSENRDMFSLSDPAYLSFGAAALQEKRRVSDASAVAGKCRPEDSEGENRELSQRRGNPTDNRGCIPKRGKYIRKTKTWNDMFLALVAYKKKHGNVRVPQTYDEDPKLGTWVKNMRQRGREQLADEDQKKLDSLGFEWTVNKKARRREKRKHQALMLEQKDP